MRIAIYKGDDRGCVDYNPYTKEVEVHHPDKQVRKKVYEYLTKKQSFKLGGGSGDIGDFKMVKEVPIQETHYLELAMCMLYENTRVHVDWSDSNNTGHNSYDQEETVVTKSLDGTTYKLI